MVGGVLATREERECRAGPGPFGSGWERLTRLARSTESERAGERERDSPIHMLPPIFIYLFDLCVGCAAFDNHIGRLHYLCSRPATNCWFYLLTTNLLNWLSFTHPTSTLEPFGPSIQFDTMTNFSIIYRRYQLSLSLQFIKHDSPNRIARLRGFQ